jgi:iron complex transport system substrate-binding protein
VRAVGRIGLAFLALLCGCVVATAEIRIKDVEDRTVTLAKPARRLLLGDGHLLVSLALVHRDPASLVVASQGDLKRHSPAIWERLRTLNARALDAVRIVGEAAPDTFSVEAALESAPDLAVFGGLYGPSPRTADVMAKLEAAGVPVVFVDFYERPLRNTARSMRILAAAIGRDAEGDVFATFWERRAARIAEKVEALPAAARPSVFLQAFGGSWDCCWTPGRAGLGEFVAAAGGRNVSDELFGTRPWGQAGIEFVLAADPAFYVTTGNPGAAARGGVSLGPDVSRAAAERSFHAALKTMQLADLTSVQQGRSAALWHLLHGLPLNVLALEVLTARLHPSLVPGLDPRATLDEINRRFLAVPLSGDFWAGLP